MAILHKTQHLTPFRASEASLRHPKRHNGCLNFVAAFTPNLVNELRLGLNKTSVPFTCDGSNIIDKDGVLDPFGYGTDYAFEQSTGVGTISDFGCTSLGDSNSQYRRYGTWFLADNAVLGKGPAYHQSGRRIPLHF